MLKKLRLIDNPEDAFANGFMLGCLFLSTTLAITFVVFAKVF